MADAERQERHFSTLEVTRVSYGVWVDSHYRDIPQRDLMVVLLNTAVVTKFNLDGSSFAAEGGVRGRVNGIPIELTNFGDSFENQRDIGLIDDFSNNGFYAPEPPHLKKIFDFYEKLLREIFDGEKGSEILAEKHSTPEQTLNLINRVLSEVGGEGFSDEVRKKLLSMPLGQRAYLRGLYDEEIMNTFVEPPLEVINPDNLPKLN